MSEEPLELECADHGKRIATVVCGHLANGSCTPLGFIENSSDPKDLQAWCYACEYFYGIEQDMTPAFKVFTDMKMVCTLCYEKIKKFNTVYE